MHSEGNKILVHPKTICKIVFIFQSLIIYKWVTFDKIVTLNLMAVNAICGCNGILGFNCKKGKFVAP